MKVLLYSRSMVYDPSDSPHSVPLATPQTVPTEPDSIHEKETAAESVSLQRTTSWHLMLPPAYDTAVRKMPSVPATLVK
tara:strand:- start:408 stop:644 length:237 start_codon:yes stop_codon:yes gene_type:complete